MCSAARQQRVMARLRSLAAHGSMTARGLLSIVLVLLATQSSAETTDATKSVASGNGLQYATSGVQASFTVTAKVTH